MNRLVLCVFALGAALGVGHWADLALGGIDPATGLCAVGSVWWRYASLAAVTALAVLAGRRAPVRPAALLGRRPLLGGVALLGGVCFAGVGALHLLLAVQYALPAMALRGALQLACAAWLFCLGAAWLRRGRWRAPAGGLVLAVLGSAVFYLQVLARFMENSSSWHRVAPTALVWQALAALVFLSALVRSLYLPGTSDGRTLSAGALAAYCLALCWQLPETVLFTAEEPAQWLGGLLLCCAGALGGAAALVSLGRGAKAPPLGGSA